MEPIQKPLTKINDLPEDARKAVLAIVRIYVAQCPEIKKAVGIECAEEAILTLMDKGIVRMKADEEENIHLGFYDFERLQYVYPSLGDSWKL